MEVAFSDEGEHCWLRIQKVRQNTEQVVKALARFAGAAYRNVAYSGMKGYFAVTEQWFSVWNPTAKPLNWSGFEFSGVKILEVRQYARKLKRGTHKSNRFEIHIRNLSSNSGVNIIDLLETRCQQLSGAGVPNYYGA